MHNIIYNVDTIVQTSSLNNQLCIALICAAIHFQRLVKYGVWGSAVGCSVGLQYGMAHYITDSAE